MFSQAFEVFSNILAIILIAIIPTITIRYCLFRVTAISFPLFIASLSILGADMLMIYKIEIVAYFAPIFVSFLLLVCFFIPYRIYYFIELFDDAVLKEINGQIKHLSPFNRIIIIDIRTTNARSLFNVANATLKISNFHRVVLAIIAIISFSMIIFYNHIIPISTLLFAS